MQYLEFLKFLLATPTIHHVVHRHGTVQSYNVDLGEGMQAYFDEKNKVWVFPGEDPAEKARPIGLPPTVTTTHSGKI
jgi:hypothetical protein